MPELPEVEVTRRRIAPLFVGRRIAKVVATRQSYFFLTPPARLERELRGAHACARSSAAANTCSRTLDDGRRLLLHLGMTGQLFAEHATSVRLLSAATRGALAPEAQPRLRARSRIHTCGSSSPTAARRVFFRDVRKFGKVRLLGAGESDAAPRPPRRRRAGRDRRRAVRGHAGSARWRSRACCSTRR